MAVRVKVCDVYMCTCVQQYEYEVRTCIAIRIDQVRNSAREREVE